MTVRERILMIRLMERIGKYPTYAETLGIEAAGVTNNQIEKLRPEGSQNE